MSHRVLDEWLKDEGRNQTLERLARGVHAGFEAIAEARFLDREVLVDQLELLGERHLEARGGGLHLVKEVAQVVEDGVGIVAPPRAPQLPDRVKGVEEKVRPDLR